MTDPVIQAAVATVAALLRAQQQQQTVQDRLLRPAKVVAYDAPTNVAGVIVDGDTEPVNAVCLTIIPPDVGVRVMVSFERPRGIFVVAGIQFP